MLGLLAAPGGKRRSRAEAPAEIEVLDRIQLPDQPEVLVDDVDRAVHLRRPALDPRARIRLVDPGKDLHQRRLAGPVLADQRHDLARGNREVHAVERLQTGKGLAQPRTVSSLEVLMRRKVRCDLRERSSRSLRESRSVFARWRAAAISASVLLA